MEYACEHDGDRIELKVPCRAEYVRTIRRAVAEFAQSCGLPRTDIEEIEVAISEAVSNVVRHAYVDCDRSPSVRVKCSRSSSGLIIEVIDRGRGFAAPADGVTPDVDMNRDGGLGIILIKSLMDRVSYVSSPEEGTRIRMRKHWRTRARLKGKHAQLAALPT